MIFYSGWIAYPSKISIQAARMNGPEEKPSYLGNSMGFRADWI